MSKITFYTKLKHNEIIKNGHGVITVTPLSDYTLDHTVKNGGSGRELNIYEIYGSDFINTRLVLATIKVAVTNVYLKEFTKSPYINNNNFKLELVDKVNSINKKYSDVGTTVGRVTSYTFNLIYNHSAATSVDRVMGNIVNLYSNQFDVIEKYDSVVRGGATTETTGDTDTRYFNNFDFGIGNQVKINGETRRLRVRGLPQSVFYISAVNEDWESIIDPNLTGTDDIIAPNGYQIPAITGIIPSSGVYTFDLKIPSVYRKRTQTTTTNSGASKIIVKDFSGVRINDILYNALPADRRGIYSDLGGAAHNECTKTVVSTINPDGDNENEFNITGRTWTNTSANVPVAFVNPSGRQYAIICSTHSNYSGNIPTTTNFNEWKYLYQKLDPVVSFDFQIPAECTITQVKSANNKTAVNAAALANTSLSGGVSFKYSFMGKKNASTTRNVTAAVANIPSTGGKIRREWWTQLKIVVAAKNFSSFTIPKVSNFTNSEKSSNGGTEFFIKECTWTGTGTATSLLTIGFEIIQYGDTDVDIALDITNLYEAS